MGKLGLDPPKSMITGSFAKFPASTTRSVGVQSSPLKWASLNPTI